MIKGAFIFAAGAFTGLTVGIVYGVTLGTKISGVIKDLVESGNIEYSKGTTVNGETV